MNTKESEQRRDALLLRLLKTPPQPRADRKRPSGKTEADANRTHVSGTSVESAGAETRR
jgi:hypothetical protein